MGKEIIVGQLLGLNHSEDEGSTTFGNYLLWDAA
jgi:hypothetical protein